MNPQDLLRQFLGSDMGQGGAAALENAKGKLANSGVGGTVGGFAAGGLLGVLLGSKKLRKMAGGAAGYGGAAALGALAHRAFQNWQSSPPGAAAAPSPAASVAPQASALTVAAEKFLPSAAPARNGQPFELALVLAMIAAANADGHIGPDEQRAIFERVGALPLDAEDKGFIFDALAKPPSLSDIASLAQGPEQASELYLASRLAIDVDHPMERAYLEALAHRLALPGELVQHLDNQTQAALA